jgi:hypothetical protein
LWRRSRNSILKQTTLLSHQNIETFQYPWTSNMKDVPVSLPICRFCFQNQSPKWTYLNVPTSTLRLVFTRTWSVTWLLSKARRHARHSTWNIKYASLTSKWLGLRLLWWGRNTGGGPSTM